jgi:hypothetical protein
MAADSGPLGPPDLAAINAALASAARTAELLERCKRCGLSDEELSAKVEQARALATALKREFFPAEN